MGDIYAFSDNNNNSEFLIETEIEKQLLSLKGVVWFHGILERKDAEKRITKNGEYLVRLSREKENKFVVSTKWNGKYVHVVIKNDVDVPKRLLVYYIVPKFKFSSIFELISFHKDDQYPLSNTSEAVLYRAVLASENIKKEHLFRKSVRITHKNHSKILPRSDSETLIASQRYSANFPDMNKSLTLLPTTSAEAPNKPFKPSLRLFASKLVLPRNRPKNIEIRNDKLFKESGDYSDILQSHDSVGGLQRERARRGQSMDAISPSLFGLNKTTVKTNIYSQDSGGYVAVGRNCGSMMAMQDTSVYVDPGRGSSPVTVDDQSYLPLRRVSAPDFIVTKTTVTQPKSLSLGPFLRLDLSVLPLVCCGPVEGALDPVAINKTAAFLISNPNHSLNLCVHLLQELQRIFRLAEAAVSTHKPGYRSLFLSTSAQCQKDLSIRQNAFANFVKATIVNTTSTERRIKLILFWIKVADCLLGTVCDMFHFRSVITAIFSDQISNLNVWKTIYRTDASVQSRMKSLRNAIYDGCFMRTDIDHCVPDLVQLHSVFTDADSNFDGFATTCLDIARWTRQSFDDPTMWLSRVNKDMDSVTTIPFLRELVQTETLLCLIIGKNSITYSEIDPLMAKVEDCIRIIADLRNQTTA